MPLEPWMRIGQPLEHVMDDYLRVFDAWEAGGIRGLVVGRMLFRRDDDAAADYYGQDNVVPAFPAKPEAYRDRGMEVGNDDAGRDLDKEKRLHAMFDEAKNRGWRLWIFTPTGRTPASRAPDAEPDRYGARHLAAVWDEVFSAFPQVEGGIMDGWAEAPYYPVAVFDEMNDGKRAQAEARGYDVGRLDRGRLHLKNRFASFTPAMVRYYGAGGVLAEMNLFDVNEDAVYWLRWRREDGIRTGQAARRELDALSRPLLLGNGPRSALFSGMTGLDFSAWDEILDLLLVKHYFWHRGFDGMYGTIASWVQQVQAWNPGLSESDCFTVVRAWLGVDLPGVESLADMNLGFPQEFFDELVYEETRRALAAASEAGKVVPWVDTGRMPHRGDPMTAGDLHRILQASEAAGLQRFLFHNHDHLTAAEWEVISRLCGTQWDENENGYWPPNSPRPSRH